MEAVDLCFLGIGSAMDATAVVFPSDPVSILASVDGELDLGGVDVDDPARNLALWSGQSARADTRVRSWIICTATFKQ